MNRYEQHQHGEAINILIRESRNERGRFRSLIYRVLRSGNPARFNRDCRNNEPAPLDERQRKALMLESMAEGGKIAVVHWGMDCDCSRWSDRVVILPAHPVAMERWENDFYNNAEGPQGHYFTSPSDAERLTPESRDLALEAFENGHPHAINAGW